MSKDMIFETAIKLFNSNGFQNVTFDLINKELEINFIDVMFYFKNKEELFLGIFEKITDEAKFSLPINKTEKAILLYMVFEKTVRTQENYTFLYRDLFLIFEEFPKFKELYSKEIKKKTNYIKYLIEALVKDGYFKESVFEEIELLISIKWINITFWKMNNSNFNDKWNELEKNAMKKFIYTLVYEHLTPIGLNLFKEVINSDIKELNSECFYKEII